MGVKLVSIRRTSKNEYELQLDINAQREVYRVKVVGDDADGIKGVLGDSAFERRFLTMVDEIRPIVREVLKFHNLP